MNDLLPLPVLPFSPAFPSLKFPKTGSGVISVALPHSDVVQGLGAGKTTDCPFFLGSPLKSKEFMSLALGARLPAPCLFGAFYLGHIPGSFLCPVPPAWSRCQPETAMEVCVQGPSTEAETILSHCPPSEHFMDPTA